MKPYRACIVLSLCFLLSGCTSIYKFRIADSQDDNRPPVDLSLFFKANGFVSCTSKDSNHYAEWAKTYKGGWSSDEPVSASPNYKGLYNGYVSASEYWEDGYYWVIISSCHREMEADCVADNLKAWLLNATPKVDVTYDVDHYLDPFR